VIGAPLDHDTTGRPGARFGPAAVRAATDGARYRLDPLTLEPAGFFDYGTGETLLQGVRLADAGDVPVVPGASSTAARGRLTDAVLAVLKRGALPFVIGGDHSITRAVLAACDEPLHVVHLDAHTDLGDASSSLPLHHGNVMTYVVEQLTWVTAVHQIGLRGVYDRLGHVEHPKVRQLGIDALRAGGLDRFLAGIPSDALCYLSVDIDVVDPAFAPATGTPVPGGLFPHELKALVRRLAQSRAFLGMDLVEVAEPTSPSDGTAALAAACILSFAQGIVERLGRDEDGGAG
jgi:agmatinase